MSENANPSTLRAALRLVLQGVRGGDGIARDWEGPKRRVAADRGDLGADPARIRRFLALTAGERIPDFTGENALLPPTLPSLWETALALEVLSSAGIGLPRGGLIHIESELFAIRPMHASERFRTRVELDRVEAHARGTRLVLRSRNWNAAGDLCCENTAHLLARSGVPARAVGDAPARSPEVVQWRVLREVQLPANLGWRYARLSGDYNPIHLWPWSARLLGFRRPILHGYCIEALVAHILISELLAGESRALRRLVIAFRAPILLPARVRLEVSPSDGTGSGFRLVDARDPSQRPYAEGRVVGGG